MGTQLSSELVKVGVAKGEEMGTTLYMPYTNWKKWNPNIPYSQQVLGLYLYLSYFRKALEKMQIVVYHNFGIF